MKYSLLLFLALFSFSAMAQQEPAQAAPTFSAKTFKSNVKLNSGTIVILETNETAAMDDVTIGQTLHFKVKTDVTVNGRTVIRTGATAIGRVKNMLNATYNDPAMIDIELSYVQAVDGQMVPLDGDPLTIKGTFPNEGATINQGTTVTGRVMNNISINTKG